MTASTPTRTRGRLLRPLVVAVAAVTLFTACADAGEPGTTTAESSGDRVDGGVLNAHIRATTTIDPRRTHSPVGRALADSLLDIDPETFELKPWLAEEWEVNDTQTEFTFKLREDVTFSDGEPLNAEAVAANFDATKQQDADGFGWYTRGLFDYYTGTEVVDEYTAVVKFSEPNPSFLVTVPTSFLSIQSPVSLETKTYEERQIGDFAGSGPFVLESFTPNEGIVLKRRDDYNWASGLSSHQGAASIEEIRITFVAEQSTRESALQSGEIQLAQNPTLEGKELLESQDYQVLYRAQVGNPYSFVFNFELPLSRDIAVRRALALVIDRETIQNDITTDLEPTSTSILTPQTSGYSDQSELIRYDPEEAKQILDDAGWVPGADGIREKDGQRLSLTVVNWWEPKSIIDTLTYSIETAAEAGIELKVVNEPSSSDTWSSGKAEILYQNSTRAEGGHTIYSYYADHFLEPNVHAKGEDVTEPGSNLNDIVVKSFTESDPDARQELLDEAQHIILRDALRITIFDNVNSESGYFAASPKLHGLRNNSLSELVFYEAWLED